MNIVYQMQRWAAKRPNKRALIVPADSHANARAYRHLTYHELDVYSDYLAFRLTERGLTKGRRVLLFVKPSLDFIITVFALFKVGAVPILIDPGMGRKNLLAALAHVAPQVVITEPKGLLLRLLAPKVFQNVDLVITTRDLFWRGQRLTSLRRLIGPLTSQRYLELATLAPFSVCEMEKNDLAAILYTSGGTGVPKGVVYTHAIFEKQIKLLRQLFHLSEHDIDLPGFPFFALFTLNMGLTVCLPKMDPSRPAQADPAHLIELILDQEVTFVGGSPAIWERVANFALEKEIKLPSLKTVAMFGAPVATHLHHRFRAILTHPEAMTYTPYGATESLPITVVSGQEVLAVESAIASGRGIYVGHAAPEMEIKIIKSSAGKTLATIEQAQELPAGEVGEIIVSGEVVTREYYRMSEQTALAKIEDAVRGKFWHRMGDLGYLDENGGLWFCGRQAHAQELAGQSYYSVCCEAITNQHPLVRRSALIALRRERTQEAILALAIERHDGRAHLTPEESERFERELRTLVQQHPHTSSIEHFFVRSTFPVDVRHNIKIDRQKLAQSIQQERRGELM